MTLEDFAAKVDELRAMIAENATELEEDPKLGTHDEVNALCRRLTILSRCRFGRHQPKLIAPFVRTLSG